MLYVTTRDQYDAFTAHRAMREDRAPNGGLYLPFRMPVLTKEDLLSLGEKSFGQCAADILNLFFSSRFTGWDVEFCIGRHPARLANMSHRVLMAELWHNQDGDYAYLERTLTERITGAPAGRKPCSWMGIAIRIAVLFGVYGQLLRSGLAEPEKAFDAALPAGDFSAVMAVWYARQMGLPVANIICACEGSSAVWDLLHLGEVRTAGREAENAIPEELERLVCGTLGPGETLRFCRILEWGGLYTLRPDMLENLRSGMFAAVVSRDRLEATIPSVYRTGGYILGPGGALAYGGLLDYRARTGESREALLICDRSPACDAACVAGAMGLTEKKLKEKLT